MPDVVERVFDDLQGSDRPVFMIGSKRWFLEDLDGLPAAGLTHARRTPTREPSRCPFPAYLVRPSEGDGDDAADRVLVDLGYPGTAHPADDR